VFAETNAEETRVESGGHGLEYRSGPLIGRDGSRSLGWGPGHRAAYRAAVRLPSLEQWSLEDGRPGLGTSCCLHALQYKYLTHIRIGRTHVRAHM